MNKEEIVKRFMATYEPDTFLKNKHGVYLYYSQNGVSGINLESFFEDLVEYVLDQQTEQLKKELEEKEKEAEKWKKAWGESEFICSINFKMNEKQVIDLQSQLSEKDKELSELKAKHKEEIINFTEFIGQKLIKQSWFKFDVNGWYIPETSKHLPSKEFVELYYTQTHGQ